jgi:hypothetical protein
LDSSQSNSTPKKPSSTESSDSVVKLAS